MMLSQSSCASQLKIINVRIATISFALLLLLLKITIGIWILSSRYHAPVSEPVPVIFGILFGDISIIWGLTDIVLVIGAWKKHKLMINIWIGLNIAIIGMIFAVFGFWQLTICMIFFAIALLFGINLMTEIEEESTNYSEMISLANNVDDRDAIN